ncbi:MAG: DUF2341 domain-containing protein [Chitinivibrionales bacterium]|nr:DUF2341 domain-containing protein [Chitinivibrionales bacterium]
MKKVTVFWGAIFALSIFCGSTFAAITPASWQHNMTITFPGYTKTSTLTNFPVLIIFTKSISGFAYNQFSSATGGDLRFTTSGGTELNYEIEKWDTSGSSYIWVQVPSLSSSTSIIAYWGNSSAVAAPTYTTNGATWDSSFIAVLHMNGKKGRDTCLDATNHHHNFDNAGISSDTIGRISGGYNFKGSLYNGFLGADASANQNAGMYNRDTPQFMAGLAQFTMSCWVYYRGFDNPDAITLMGYNDCLEWGIQNNSNAPMVWAFSTTSYIPHDLTTTGVALNTWSHLVVTGGAGHLFQYINGIQADAGGTWSGLTANGGTTPGPVIAKEYAFFTTYGSAMNGIMDECRFEKTYRSADWVWASWKNQSSPDFCSYGAPSAVNQPVANNKSFTFQRSGDLITYNLAKPAFVSIKYYDLQGRTICSFVNNTQQEGTHVYKLPVASLPRNVYIQEFIAGDFVKKERVSVSIR